ncbi:MAG: FHA domain-containing protein [Planctomycetota bacterium]|nr:FHA domain-containing protein [Planctomycetota bacterium]
MSDGNQFSEDVLLSLVTSHFSGNETPDEIIACIRAVGESEGISDDVVASVTEKCLSQQPGGQTGELESESRSLTQHPRLLVNWGELPRIGHQVRPEFSLLCPVSLGFPDIAVTVDSDLDHNSEEPTRQPKIEDDGLWTFCIPFRMTTDGLDCRPGQYIIDVSVVFSRVPSSQPQCYRCRIHLNAPGGDERHGSVLEIEGDGQSVVNLQGYDLRSFSRVVLKGGEDGVINLQQLNTGDETSDDSSSSISTGPAVTFEYELKTDLELQRRMPRLTTRFPERVCLKTAGLFFSDGRRILLHPNRRLTLGRNRSNDVVIRFLPRSDRNDPLSRNVSRTHAILELTEAGLLVRDDSKTGLELNYNVVKDEELLSSEHAGESVRFDLGCIVAVSQPFSLNLELYVDRTSDKQSQELDELYCDFVGERISRVWRLAHQTQINSVRIDRVENLAGAESYVLLYGSALIGSSRAVCPITLLSAYLEPPARILYMGRTFWLERLSDAVAVAVNDHEVACRTLVPLSPGMSLRFGEEEVVFNRSEQMYLD